MNELELLADLHRVAFLHAHGNSPAAEAIVEEYRHEIELYERYGQYFGYGFYITRKVDEG